MRGNIIASTVVIVALAAGIVTTLVQNRDIIQLQDELDSKDRIITHLRTRAQGYQRICRNSGVVWTNEIDVRTPRGE